MDANSHPVYEFGAFRLELNERLLTQKGEPIAITPKAFDVLVLLIERRGHLVEKNELMREVWADSFVEEANLSRTIWMLRQALDDDRNGHGLIQTVPKHGYRFVADVVEVPFLNRVDSDTSFQVKEEFVPISNGAKNVDLGTGLTIEGQLLSGAIDELHTTQAGNVLEFPTKPASRSRRYLPIFVALLILLSLSAFTYLLRTRTDNPPVRAPITSLAVLPLENLSGDATQEYIADGVTEGLIASISRAKSIRVTAPKSAMAYRGTSKSATQIAAELGVDALVTGSFANDGNGVHLESRLIDPKAGVTLWSKSYTRNLGNIWALQNEIARDVVAKLGTDILTEPNHEQPVNTEAYDLYLRGRFRLSDNNPESILEAIDLQERAAKLDPAFVQAYAELARACNLYDIYYAGQEKRWEEKAFVAAERVKVLGPDLPEAHLVSGYILWTQEYGFPHEQAIQEYKLALELNPSLDDARYQLGRIYMHIGLYEKAIAEYKLALAINPKHVVPYLRLAVVANYQQKYQDSLEMQDSMPPDLSAATRNYQRAWSLYHLKRYHEVTDLVAVWRKANAKDEEGGLLTSMQALLAARGGNRAEAEKYIKLTIEYGSGFDHFHHSAYTIAAAYAIINKPEDAVKWLQFAAENGFPNYPLFSSDPDLESLRQDSRFVEFMTKQKELWEQRMKTL